MYATKRLRGLLALWLVLILVFGLGTTVYAAEYKIDISAGQGLYQSDGSTLYTGNLYPGDTIGTTTPQSNSGSFVVYYSDRASYDSTGANATVVDENNTSHVNFGYYQAASHGVLDYNKAGSTAYKFSIAKKTWTTGGLPVYQLTLTEIGAPPPPSPEPAPAPIRCDLPVLFDPVGPVEKYGGAGGSVTMSVSARDALRFQWQVNYNDGTGWHNVEGAVTDTYTLENLDAIHEGWQFRCVVRNNCGPVISPNFTVHVHVPVAEVPETGGPGAALAALALGLASLGAGLGIARKRRG